MPSKSDGDLYSKDTVINIFEAFYNLTLAIVEERRIWVDKDERSKKLIDKLQNLFKELSFVCQQEILDLKEKHKQEIMKLKEQHQKEIEEFKNK